MTNKPNYYAVIPASVRYDDTLKPNAKLLYGEITALANDKGYCWASNAYFAKLYNVSNETVSRWVSNLEIAGHISTEITKTKNIIVERRIRIARLDEIVMPTCGNSQDGLDEKVNLRLDEKVKENNTDINNTFNNIYRPEAKRPYKGIIEYLNGKTGANYKHTTRKTQGLIDARFNEGFSEQDFYSVIDKKTADWNGTEYQKYLRPETLFGNKFESYLNQQIIKNKSDNPFAEMLKEMEYAEKGSSAAIGLPAPDVPDPNG